MASSRFLFSYSRSLAYKGIWIAKSKSLLLELLSIVTVIDTPHEVMIAGLNSRMSDIEDSLQYNTALHHKMDFISGDKGLKNLCHCLLTCV